LVPLPTPHVKRQCEECGETVHVAEPGEGGRGVQVMAGDQFVIPAGYLRLSLDPSQATGTFFRGGVPWFVSMLYFQGFEPNTSDDLRPLLDQYRQEVDKVLENSSLLGALDLENPDDAGEAVELVRDQADKPEWWAMMMGAHVSLVKGYIEDGEAQKAAHAMGVLANARAMLIFLQSLEENVWRGYSLGGLRSVLEIWAANNNNADEEFWQATLAQNVVILSQVFSFPVIILRDRAYIGGMGLDQSGANIVDFLLANDLTANTALVEIKTPKTTLLGRRYRGNVYPPSREIAGAVAQISNYKHSLITNSTQPEIGVSAFNPPSLVVAGTLDQLTDEARKRSFELYRQGLRDVQIVTYDELFHKVANLVTLLQVGASAG
jgi:hypothetical protein